jgi:hypothetical protein
VQVALPKRAPGMSDQVVVGGGSRHWWYDSSAEDLRGPLHPPPEFPEPLCGGLTSRFFNNTSG